MPARFKIDHTVLGARLYPRLASSPWIRRGVDAPIDVKLGTARFQVEL
jgi:hypothetical protein